MRDKWKKKNAQHQQSNKIVGSKRSDHIIKKSIGKKKEITVDYIPLMKSRHWSRA